MRKRRTRAPQPAILTPARNTRSSPDRTFVTFIGLGGSFAGTGRNSAVVTDYPPTCLDGSRFAGTRGQRCRQFPCVDRGRLGRPIQVRS